RIALALKVLPDITPPQPALELQLNTALGDTLVYTRGSSSEATTAFVSALGLAERLDHFMYRKRALWGLWINRIMAADYRSALVLAERFRVVANRGPTVGLVADRMLALA